MEVSITYRHMDHDDAIRENVEGKLAKLDHKYQLRIKDVTVVLEQKKHLYFAEVILYARDLKGFGESESDKNIYVAIDEAVNRVEVQLKKHKEKIKHRKVKDSKEAALDAANVDQTFENQDEDEANL